jgi:hypothetical protein
MSNNKYEQSECSICLESLNQNIKVLECEHVFHIKCISLATEYRDKCPLCRHKIKEESFRQYNDNVYINRNKRGGRGGFSIEDEI